MTRKTGPRPRNVGLVLLRRERRGGLAQGIHRRRRQCRHDRGAGVRRQELPAVLRKRGLRQLLLLLRPAGMRPWHENRARVRRMRLGESGTMTRSWKMRRRTRPKRFTELSVGQILGWADS